MKSFRTLAIAIGIVAFAAGAPLASATPTLTLDLNDNGGNTASVVDLGVTGFVNYSAALGTGPWIVNVTTGLGDILLGLGHIDLNSVNVSSGTGGHLTLTLTETGINFATGSGLLSMLDFIGGTLGTAAGNHIDWIARLDGVAGCGGTFSGGGPFSNSPGCNFSAAVADLSNFSMQLQVDIYHVGRQSSSFDNELLIPEPGTLFLLGAGLIGLAGLRRRKTT